MSLTSLSLSLLLSLLYPALHLCFYVPNQSVLLPFSDQVRERHLYTESRRHGLFLEMTPSGSVRGSPVQSANTVMELRSVKAGETVIKAVASSLFLCVDHAGHLTGQQSYTESDCTFRELLLADGYSLFLSPHTGLPLSITSKQSGQKHRTPLSRFLPVKNTQFWGTGRGEEEQEEEAKRSRQNMDLDSDDPLGMGPLSHNQFVFSTGLDIKK